MKLFAYLIVLAFLYSCSTNKFIKEEVCSTSSLKYLSLARNKTKHKPLNLSLGREVLNTQKGMQYCYDDFKRRTGKEEFRTCLVVGVDNKGSTEFLDVSSKEAVLDNRFKKCATQVAKQVPFAQFGRNYIFIQSYNFYNL